MADLLRQRPGFLIRRLHQIHLALFAEECEPFGVSPVQFSILTVLAEQPDLQQVALAQEIGVDRTTLTNVLRRLERRGMLTRCVAARRSAGEAGDVDRGRPRDAGADAGRRRAGACAHGRGVPPAQRAMFLHALAQLVAVGNAYGRAPMRLA